LTIDPRFTRQVRLAEVGALGQERLSRAAVCPLAGAARTEVDARYLRGAGVTVVEGEGLPLAPEPAWIVSLHPAAREVAAGAYGALTVLRSVLDETPHPRVFAR
jgi:hypothetical protein